MGPRRSRRGIPKRILEVIVPPGDLQWGHGDCAVEYVVRRAGRFREPRPSMGPRRWRRGGPGITSIWTSPIVALQWGHDDGVGEDIEKSLQAAAIQMLQWGHGDCAVEDVAGIC